MLATAGAFFMPDERDGAPSSKSKREDFPWVAGGDGDSFSNRRVFAGGGEDRTAAELERFWVFVSVESFCRKKVANTSYPRLTESSLGAALLLIALKYLIIHIDLWLFIHKMFESNG